MTRFNKYSQVLDMASTHIGNLSATVSATEGDGECWMQIDIHVPYSHPTKNAPGYYGPGATPVEVARYIDAIASLANSTGSAIEECNGYNRIRFTAHGVNITVLWDVPVRKSLKRLEQRSGHDVRKVKRSARLN